MTLSLTDARATRDAAWTAHYEGAKRGLAAHRHTGGRTVEKRRAMRGLHSPLPGHVDEGTGHDGYVDELLRCPPVALRFAPTDATARRIIGSATAFQDRVAVCPGRAVERGHPGGQRARSLSLRSTVVSCMEAAAGQAATAAERLEVLQEALAVERALPAEVRQTLRAMRGELPWRELTGREGRIDAKTWTRRQDRARQAVREELLARSEGKRCLETREADAFVWGDASLAAPVAGAPRVDW
jgi:hypothetical protein